MNKDTEGHLATHPPLSRRRQLQLLVARILRGGGQRPINHVWNLLVASIAMARGPLALVVIAGLLISVTLLVRGTGAASAHLQHEPATPRSPRRKSPRRSPAAAGAGAAPSSIRTHITRIPSTTSDDSGCRPDVLVITRQASYGPLLCQTTLIVNSHRSPAAQDRTVRDIPPTMNTPPPHQADTD
jgi:hypothetical protein